MRQYLTAMTRIADLREGQYEVRVLSRDEWDTGDYVVGEVIDTSGLRNVELRNGRLIEMAEGDRVLGAFGRRFATLEATGSWHDIEEDGHMHLLTTGGLIGKCRSRSFNVPRLISLQYQGHVIVDGKKDTMQNHVVPLEYHPFTLPVALIIGTSMSAGKTTAGRIIVRLFKRAGLRVIGAKLTGAGRYRDILSMYDAGADYIFDFMDAGLPSTVVPEEVYRVAVRRLLSLMSSVKADVAVIEVGASPLEPYNGTVAIEEINENAKFTTLCASDPYAVAGVMKAYERQIDVVTGIATNTEAGVQLAEKLADVRALNIRDKSTVPEFRQRLFTAFEVSDVTN